MSPSTRLRAGVLMLGGALVLGSVPNVSAADAALAPPALQCQLTGPDRPVGVGQSLTLRFVLRNAGAKPVDVLVWGTPFEAPWTAPYVVVTRDGEAVAYRGAKVKRGDPRADDYLHLDPAQSREAQVDLAQAFDLRAPGRYQVTPRLTLHDVAMDGPPARRRPRDAHRAVPLSCNAVTFDLER